MGTIRAQGEFTHWLKKTIQYVFIVGLGYVLLNHTVCNHKAQGQELNQPQAGVYQQSNYPDQKAQANQQFGIGSQLEKITQYVK